MIPSPPRVMDVFGKEVNRAAPRQCEVREARVKNTERERAAGFATASARCPARCPQPALNTTQPSRPYQQLAARPQQCAMSTRAFALFESSSKSQNWLPVVSISLCLALICLLNFHVAFPRPPPPPPKKKTTPTSRLPILFSSFCFRSSVASPREERMDYRFPRRSLLWSRL